MIPVAVISLGTDQRYEPLLGTCSAMVVKFLSPLRLQRMVTGVLCRCGSLTFQVMS